MRLRCSCGAAAVQLRCRAVAARCRMGAPALQAAIETARMALAPSLDFDQPHSFLLPSSSCTILSSICCCSAGLMPTSAGPMIVFTLVTAFETPAPARRRV